MKTITKFISLICLLVWSCSAVSEGEIASYQREVMQMHLKRLYRTAAGITDITMGTTRYALGSWNVNRGGAGNLVAGYENKLGPRIHWLYRSIGEEVSYRHGDGDWPTCGLRSGTDYITWRDGRSTRAEIKSHAEDGWETRPWGAWWENPGQGFKGLHFGEQWINLMVESVVTRGHDGTIQIDPKGGRGVRCKFKIVGAEWVNAFTAYLDELKHQKKFNKEKSVLLKTNAKKTLPGLLTSENTRDRDKWREATKITLSYDEVTEEFEPTDEDIIAIIEQVGKDKNNRILNLSGCQSQACMNTLIELLKTRDDIKVLILANCNLDQTSAENLLQALSHQTQMRIIDVTGNDLPSELEQAFHTILERNLSTIHDNVIHDEVTHETAASDSVLEDSEHDNPLPQLPKEDHEKMVAVVDDIRSLITGIKTVHVIHTNVGWENNMERILTSHEASALAPQVYPYLAASIRRIGQDKTVWSFNLSGCQSQECINALIDLLKHRQDVGIVNLANCNLTVETAQRLLTAIQNNTQLQIINISGNNLPYEIVRAFQTISVRNRAALLHALINNADISSTSLFALAMDLGLDSHTLSLLAQHPNCDSELLSYIVAERSQVDSIILAAVANNPNATPELLRRIINKPHVDTAILNMVARHPNVDTELAEEIARRLAQPAGTLEQGNLPTNTTMTDSEFSEFTGHMFDPSGVVHFGSPR